MANWNAEPVAVSPSLFENISIHPVPNQFSLAMEEWTKFFFESIEPTLSQLERLLTVKLATL